MTHPTRRFSGVLATLGCVTLLGACATQPQAPSEVSITSMSPQVMDELADRIAARVHVPAPAVALPTGRVQPTGRRPARARVVVAPVPRLKPPPVEPLSADRLAELTNAVARSLDWLARHQSDNGAWECDKFVVQCKKDRCGDPGEAHYTPAATGLAVLCLLRDGNTPESGVHKEAVRQGLAYLIGIQDAEGCFGPRVSQHFQYNHAVASLAMVEAYRKTSDERLEVSARDAVNFVQMSRNPYMGWRYGVRDGDNDTSMTGWMTHVLAAARGADLEVDPAAFQGALSWIDKMTEPEFGRVGYQQRGGQPARTAEMMDRFPAELSESLTAVGVMTRLNAGQEAGTTPAIQMGADLIYARLPIWAPGSGTIDLYYWMWGTEALSRVGGNRWNGWAHAVSDALLAGQVAGANSDAHGSWPAVDPWGASGGRVYSTAFATLTLQEVRNRSSGN